MVDSQHVSTYSTAGYREEGTGHEAAPRASANGPDLTKSALENAAAVWRPAPEVFYFAKGRVALYAILRAMNIGAGDEVLVPGYTCVVVPSAIAYTGARPVYYDIDPDTYCGNAEEAESKLTDRTRVVLVQHTYGMPSEDSALIELCRRRGIHVIEDCAHAMGGMLNGRPLGTLGDAAFASYQWSKPVTVGLGGVARINNEALLAPMRTAVNNGFTEPALGKTLTVMGLAWLHRNFLTPRLYWTARGLYQALGRTGLVAPSSTAGELEDPGTMPEGYCERFGRPRMRQLKSAMHRLPATVAHGNTIAAIYQDWCNQRGIATQRPAAGSTPVHLRFPIRVRERDRLSDAARRARIELGDWFNAPLHPDIHDSPELGYTRGLCPNAEQAASEVINLPTHRRVNEQEARRILNFLDTQNDRNQWIGSSPPNAGSPRPLRGRGTG